MPRMINVDALLNELQTKFDRAERDAEFTGSRVINVSWNDAICAIKQAETVEAIPVKWIKKWNTEKNKEFWSFCEPFDKHINADEIKKIKYKDMPYFYTILTMLEDWEKENETNG